MESLGNLRILKMPQYSYGANESKRQISAGIFHLNFENYEASYPTAAQQWVFRP